MTISQLLTLFTWGSKMSTKPNATDVPRSFLLTAKVWDLRIQEENCWETCSICIFIWLWTSIYSDDHNDKYCCHNHISITTTFPDYTAIVFCTSIALACLILCPSWLPQLLSFIVRYNQESLNMSIIEIYKMCWLIDLWQPLHIVDFFQQP